jgi:glycosyltransferase involved in cell wall biosynthesis
MLRPLRGIPLYVTRLCQYLPALNRDYHFYFFINKSYEHNDKPGNYEPTINDIISNNPNVSIVNYDDDSEVKWEQIYLARLVKQYKIDLLHMPGNRICFFSGVPTIATIHDVIEYKRLNKEYLRDIIAETSSLRMKLYIAKMSMYVWANYKFGFGRASQIITVSQYSADDIVKTLKIFSSKVTAIHHGLDAEFALADTDNANIMETEPRSFVLMLGGDSPHKNPEGAIFAWSRVAKEIRRRYPLRIIGFCGNDESPLKKALNKFGLQNEVDIRGWVTQTELINYLRSAKLFIYLSRYEGFGFPPLHAMALGTPVIASNCSSIPEVLGDTGLKFDPDDYSAIASGIEKVINDNVLWQQQSVLGIARSKFFKWEDTAAQHLNVFDRVLKECYGPSI